MLHVELGGEFRLPAVLQPVRRLVQQGADQLAIAAVALATEADAVVGWRVEALQAIRAVVQHQHTGVTSAFDLHDQAEQREPGGSAQDVCPILGSVPASSRSMLLRWRQSTIRLATRDTTT